jgi:hypothetical protein
VKKLTVLLSTAGLIYQLNNNSVKIGDLADLSDS